MLPQKKTKRRLIVMTLLTLGSIACYFGVVFLIREQDKTLMELEQTVARTASVKERESSVEFLIEDTREERQKIESYLVQGDTVVSLVKEIERIASVTGLSMEITSLGIKQVLEGTLDAQLFEYVDMQLNAEGDWLAVAHFIELFEYQPIHKYISSLRIERQTVGIGQEAKEVWSVTMSARVLKLKS